jgi:N-acetylglucosamine-6-phosphate deacetylase
VLVRACHYATGVASDYVLESGRLAGVTPTRESTQLWIAPSFFDVQINGAVGFGFNSPTLDPEGVCRVVRKCREHGIGRLFPTIITDSFEAIDHGFRVLSQALRQNADLARAIPGYHLEGPYLSSEDGPRGAHPREHARDPNWDEFCRWQESAEGRIRMVTVAPERTGAIAFMSQLARAGIVVAIGHTAANSEQLRAAVAAGAKTCTHLGNGAHATLPRHPNYLWDQLANDDLWASLITDGHHLPAAVVKCFVRAKTLARTLITCDASTLAGLPPGRYADWGTELEVHEGGKIVLSGTPFLAGSGCFTDTCVSRAIEFAGLTLSEGVDLAAVQPRKLLGLPVPEFQVGEAADYVLFEWSPGRDFQIRDVVQG